MPTGFTLCIIKYYIYVLYIASYYHVTILHYHYHNKYHFICNYLKVLCIKQKLSLFGNKFLLTQVDILITKNLKVFSSQLIFLFFVLRLHMIVLCVAWIIKFKQFFISKICLVYLVCFHIS